MDKYTNRDMTRVFARAKRISIVKLLPFFFSRGLFLVQIEKRDTANGWGRAAFSLCIYGNCGARGLLLFCRQ